MFNQQQTGTNQWFKVEQMPFIQDYDVKNSLDSSWWLDQYASGWELNLLSWSWTLLFGVKAYILLVGVSGLLWVQDTEAHYAINICTYQFL